MIANERGLLIGRQLDHPELIFVMQRGKNPLVDAEIRMAHMRALDGILEGKGETAKALCGHRTQAPATERHRPLI
jgi:hypothetical protein